jgi:serine/threonine protein kinase
MTKRYSRTLSSGANNAVIALTEFEVGKIFSGDTRSDIGSEAEKMKLANSINGLIVKFIRLDLNEELKSDMLVMERLFPLDYRAYEQSKRELFLDVFLDEINQLHEAGFVHRDIQRPSNIVGDRFDNVFMTQTGIRLIDVGISALRSQVGESMFKRFVEKEREELKIFEDYFLSR